ncbi:MAG: hypothetical protein ACE3L7_22310 [Candidatus Pristimantibacillus sp.]
MNKITLLLIVVCFLMTVTACGSPVETFEDTIDSMNDNGFLVNCSEEVNRGKTGNINAIGYLCNVDITNTTSFEDDQGNALQYEDFVQGDFIRITLAKPQNISETNRTFDAKEIVLLEAVE